MLGLGRYGTWTRFTTQSERGHARGAGKRRYCGNQPQGYHRVMSRECVSTQRKSPGQAARALENQGSSGTQRRAMPRNRSTARHTVSIDGSKSKDQATLVSIIGSKSKDRATDCVDQCSKTKDRTTYSLDRCLENQGPGDAQPRSMARQPSSPPQGISVDGWLAINWHGCADCRFVASLIPRGTLFSPT